MKSDDIDSLPPTQSPPEAIDMEQQSVGEALTALQRLMNYSATLPDAFRSAREYAGELVRDSASWLVPAAFRNSQSYSVFAQQMFEYVVNDLANAFRRESSTDPGTTLDDKSAQVLLARKTVGSLLDMTALATFHVSPLTVMAMYAEQAYQSPMYLKRLVFELREQGILSKTATVDSSQDLIHRLESATGRAASCFDQPPLSIAGLHNTLQDTQATVHTVQPERLLPLAEIDQLWRQMYLAARDQRGSIWDVSATISIVALNNMQNVDTGGVISLNVQGNLYQFQVIDHYWEGLRAIEQGGLLSTFSSAVKPYVETVWNKYAVSSKSWTEQLRSGELLKWGWSSLSWPKLSR